METPKYDYTFYYSRFSVFGPDQEQSLLSSLILQDRLYKRLGPDWSKYASQILYSEKEGQRVFLSEKVVFSAALTLFQAQTEESMQRLGQKRDPEPNFESFEAEFIERFRNFKKNETCFKAVLQAFYSTACQLWGSGQEPSSSRKTLKIQKKVISKRKQSLSSHSRLRPLIMITERSKSLKSAFRRLKIAEDESKGELYAKKVSQMEQEILEMDLGRYIAQFVANSKEKWQIARCFVANVFEVNFNKIMEMEHRVKDTVQDLKNKVRVRILQPAESFYQQLMRIWLILNDISSSRYDSAEVSFAEYLDKVKETMGPVWSEKYLSATRLFFETLIIEWRALSLDVSNEERTLGLLLRRAREDLSHMWDERVLSGITASLTV